ncbi:hypothetical protein QFZ79_003132 [Arthrobacter sp. V4I6]|nr:hypothetical protein [Arthrobacter sp. V4I6]
MDWRVPIIDQNDSELATPTTRRSRVSPLAWTAGGLLILGMTAGAVLSVIPDGTVRGAAPVTTTASEPEPSATATASTKPGTARATPVPERTLRYTSCNDVWAGGQGPFKEGEPGYTKQLDSDGDGIACKSRPKIAGRAMPFA